MPYAVVEADEAQPGFTGAFGQVPKPLGPKAFGGDRIELEPGAEGREHDRAGSPPSSSAAAA